jgi:hypothetical protein
MNGVEDRNAIFAVLNHKLAQPKFLRQLPQRSS